MVNKIAIITGANDGLGFETTIEIAKSGYTVVMACRNKERAERAKQQIIEQVPEAKLDVMLVDLSQLSSVRAFASDFAEKYKQLNLLINNAGIMNFALRRNEEGHELQFATNHLGHFLLTKLVIDLMPDESSSRIVSLSSIAHKMSEIYFDDLQCENGKKGSEAYGQSKLACLMFSSELQRRLDQAGKKCLSVCAHPGVSMTGLFEDMSPVQAFFGKLITPLVAHSNENAAKPSVFAALSDTVKGGEYYGPKGFLEMKGAVGLAKRTPYSEDVSFAQQLWSRSEELVGQKFEL